MKIKKEEEGKSFISLELYNTRTLSTTNILQLKTSNGKTRRTSTTGTRKREKNNNSTKNENNHTDTRKAEHNMLKTKLRFNQNASLRGCLVFPELRRDNVTSKDQ